MPTFFERIFGAKAAGANIRSPFVAGIASTMFATLGNKRNEAEYLKEYRGWVFACVQARAEAVAAIEIVLKKDGEVVPESDVLDLIYRVNPYMTKRELMYGTQAYLDLAGNAFWFLARDNDGQGKIQEIYLMRPDKMQVVPSKENPLTIAGYVYKANDGKNVPFDVKEILHFKNFNPMGNHPFPHRGMGIVEAACWSIDTDNEAQTWNYSFFKNSARPDGVLTKEGQMDENEYKRLRTQWQNTYGGADRAHKMAILTGGLKWQELGRSQKESDFLQQRAFSRDEIFALFRTPKTVLGMVEDVNRANAEATNFVFAERTVKPLMCALTDTLTEFLLPEFGEGLELDFVSPVPNDRAQVIQEYSLGLNKWLTRNEIREREGLPPSNDGDTIMGTLAEVPVDSVTQTAKATAQPASKGAAKVIEDFIAKFPVAKAQRKLGELARTNYKELWVRQILKQEQALKKDVQKYFTAQEYEVIGNITNELKGLEQKEYSMKAASDLMFDEEGAVKAGIDLLTPYLEAFVKESGGQATLLTGAAQQFDPTTPAIRKFIKQRAKFFAESINETTRETLFAQLQEGLALDESISQLSARVAEVYGKARDFRSDRIARTEASAASNEAAMNAYKQAGIEMHEWVVVNPEDDDCIMNDGEVVKIGDAFPSGVTRAGDDHPNCMCQTVPVFEEE